MNNRGIYVRNTVGEIYLKKAIFNKEMFYDALSTYVHEFNFSRALTFAMEILLANSDVVKCSRTNCAFWESISLPQHIVRP